MSKKFAVDGADWSTASSICQRKTDTFYIETVKSPQTRGKFVRGDFVLVLTTTSFTCGGEKAEALIRKNKASSGIIEERRQPQTRPEEAEYGRKQFITYEVEMSISHSDYTEISQKSDI